MPDRELMGYLRRLGQRVRAIGHSKGLDMQSFSVIPDLEGSQDSVQMIFVVNPDALGVDHDTSNELAELEAQFAADDTEELKEKHKERIDSAAELAKKLRDPKGGLW